MANNLPQQSFPGSILSEEIAADEDGTVLDCDLYSQQETQQHLTLGNMCPTNNQSLSETFPAFQIQSQGMRSAVETELESSFFEIGNSLTPIQNPIYYAAIGNPPALPSNNQGVSGVWAANTEIVPNSFPTNDPQFNMHYGLSDHNLNIQYGDYEQYTDVMSGQSDVGHFHLNDMSSVQLYDEGWQQALGFQYGVSQPHEPIQGTLSASYQLANPNFIQLDLDQSSSSAFSRFDAFAVSAPELNRFHDADVKINQMWEDVNPQQGSLCFLGNISMTQASNGLIQERGSSQNPIVVPDSPENTIEVQRPQNHEKWKEHLPKAFGPSRPISLPPARKGGRKGTLSAEQKRRRREAKKEGVCIRCRSFGKKCYGGFPCIPCRKNLKPALWKHPCTKAQFLDLVEHGSCFEDMQVFEIYTLEKLDEKSFTQHMKLAGAIGFLLGDKLARKPCECDPIHISHFWVVGTQIYKDVLQQARTFKTAFSRQLIKTLPNFLQPKHLRPIHLNRLVSSKILWEHLQPRIIIQDYARSIVSETLKNVELPNEILLTLGLSKTNIAQELENTAKILVWIFKRSCELLIFQSLQIAANRLNSLSTDLTSTSNTARLFLTGLLMDPDWICNTGDRFPYHIQELRGERLVGYKDHKTKIRQALFIYFSITLSKLPPWHDFWPMERIELKNAAPDLFKHRHTDLESFDWYWLIERKRVQIHMQLLSARKENFGSSHSLSGKQKFKADRSIVEEILMGPRSTEADLQAIVKHLSDFWQPLTENFRKFSDIMIENSPYSAIFQHISLVLDTLVLQMRNIRQFIEQELINQHEYRGKSKDQDKADHLASQAFLFVAQVEQAIINFMAIAGGLLNEVKVNSNQ